MLLFSGGEASLQLPLQPSNSFISVLGFESKNHWEKGAFELLCPTYLLIVQIKKLMGLGCCMGWFQGQDHT